MICEVEPVMSGKNSEIRVLDDMKNVMSNSNTVDGSRIPIRIPGHLQFHMITEYSQFAFSSSELPSAGSVVHV